jgi:hypothetical protein
MKWNSLNVEGVDSKFWCPGGSSRRPLLLWCYDDTIISVLLLTGSSYGEVVGSSFPLPIKKKKKKKKMLKLKQAVFFASP